MDASSQDGRVNAGVGPSIDNMQDYIHRSAICVAPAKKVWLPSQRVLDCVPSNVNFSSCGKSLKVKVDVPTSH